MSGRRELFGRGDAVASIVALLSGVERGCGAGLVIEGVAGIGKTALLRHAEERARELGFETRTTTAAPLDTGLAFGVLGALVGPELRAEQLAERGSALGAAVGHKPLPEPPSVMGVASDVIEIWSKLGHARPLLITLDDAQWADPSSVEVLTHVARHAVADRIGVLMTRRSADPDLPVARSLSGLEVIALAPLSRDDTVAALIDVGYPPEQASRWADRCGGLPLAVAELGRRSGDRPPDPQLIGRMLPESYAALVASLPSDIAEAVLLAAVCSELAVLRAVGGANLAEALRRAEDIGLLVFEHDATQRLRLEFRHPLLRAAVLASSTPSHERAAHQRVASAFLAASNDDRAAIHLAAAADGPDPQAAQAMAGMAERSRRRGALPEAARAFLRAAALSADEASRARLLTEAADSHFDAGDAASAFAAIDEAIATAADPVTLADARNQHARMSQWMHSPQAMVRELLEIAQSIRGVDPIRAASALASAASVGYLDGDLAAAVDRGRDAEALALADEHVMMATTASAALSWSLFMSGEWEEFDRRTAPIEPLMRVLLAQRSWPGVHLAEMFATTWVCSERWELADSLTREVLHVTRTMGARLSVASTSLLLASLCWRRGRWDEAYALGSPLLDDTDVPPLTLAWTRILVAQLSASMGREEQTRELIELGLSVASAADVPLIVAMAYASLGHLELSLGRDEIALAHLDRVNELTERIGFREPEFFVWQGDYLDALVRAGRHEEAHQRVALLHKLAEAGNRRWLRGVVARTTAQLGSSPSSANLYGDAIDEFEQLGMPFEVARTLLMRDRANDRADARRLFLRLGAALWARAATPATAAHLATAEARAHYGDDVVAPSVLKSLSPSELNVAMAAVSGRTNREIAAELHLSAKRSTIISNGRFANSV